jgi:hypothetical protein
MCVCYVRLEWMRKFPDLMLKFFSDPDNDGILVWKLEISVPEFTTTLLVLGLIQDLKFRFFRQNKDDGSRP